MSEIEDAKKLEPEERLRRLKELEEERKREIEEAEALIRDSFREISEAEERKHAPIKQVTADDISQLLTVEEKRMFKTARFADSSNGRHKEETKEQHEMHNLEGVAEEEARNKEQLSHAPIYGKALEEARKGIDYSARMTATGERIEQKESIHEIYSSRSVTGESEEPQNTYVRGAVEERTSGMYARKKEKRAEFAP